MKGTTNLVPMVPPWPPHACCRHFTGRPQTAAPSSCWRPSRPRLALHEAVRPHNACSGHPGERHCQPTCLCQQRPNGRAPSHTYLRCQWGRTGPGARCSTGTGGASCSASAAPRAATRVGTGHRLIRRGERERPAAALACRGASLPSRRRRRSAPASSVTTALLRGCEGAALCP